MAKKTERITLRVSREMKATLKAEAKKDKRSLSSFCEIVFTQGLLELTSQVSKEAQSQQVSA